MIESQRDLTIREMREDEEFAAWLADLTGNEAEPLGDRHLLLADEIGEWIGGLRFLIRGGVAQIVDLGVVPSERRRGHGIRLIQAFEDRARDDGAHLIEFWTDQLGMEPLLAALGWRKVATRRDYIGGRTWYLLEKRLPPVARSA
ncbi:MAG TPA: GNAT family N-acetyltransferase [Gemmatimonadales bacterium]|nr:GNAT family N-acetyltransferase [Gemmatimonadales bacterium]